MNLRQDVKFSSGNPFNAYQVWLEMYGYYYLSGNSSTWLESYALFNMTNVSFGPATIAQINQSGVVKSVSKYDCVDAELVVAHLCHGTLYNRVPIAGSIFLLPRNAGCVRGIDV